MATTQIVISVINACVFLALSRSYLLSQHALVSKTKSSCSQNVVPKNELNVGLPLCKYIHTYIYNRINTVKCDLRP